MVPDYSARHRARDVMYQTLRARYLSCEDCAQLNEYEQVIFDRPGMRHGCWIGLPTQSMPTPSASIGTRRRCFY